MQLQRARELIFVEETQFLPHHVIQYTLYYYDERRGLSLNYVF
jgi:hypothetical protein